MKILNIREEEKYYMGLYHSQNTQERNKATSYFIQKYENFVKDQMKKYCPSYIKDYYEDLFESGIIGILEALEKFDPENGSFTTWSKWYIRHQLQKYICEMILQSSEYYAALQNKIRKAIRNLEKNGVDCTLDNICEQTGLSMDIVKREMKIRELKIMSLDEVYDEVLKKSEDDLD